MISGHVHTAYIRPGDKVLVGVSDISDRGHVERMMEDLKSEFPGVEFVILGGMTSIAVIAGGE